MLVLNQYTALRLALQALDVVRAEVNLQSLISDVHCIIEAMIGRNGQVRGACRHCSCWGVGGGDSAVTCTASLKP